MMSELRLNVRFGSYAGVESWCHVWQRLVPSSAWAIESLAAASQSFQQALMERCGIGLPSDPLQVTFAVDLHPIRTRRRMAVDMSRAENGDTEDRERCDGTLDLHLRFLQAFAAWL